jgi:hypothetical protein
VRPSFPSGRLFAADSSVVLFAVSANFGEPAVSVLRRNEIPDLCNHLGSDVTFSIYSEESPADYATLRVKCFEKTSGLVAEATYTPFASSFLQTYHYRSFIPFDSPEFPEDSSRRSDYCASSIKQLPIETISEFGETKVRYSDMFLDEAGTDGRVAVWRQSQDGALASDIHIYRSLVGCQFEEVNTISANLCFSEGGPLSKGRFCSIDARAFLIAPTDDQISLHILSRNEAELERNYIYFHAGQEVARLSDASAKSLCKDSSLGPLPLKFDLAKKIASFDCAFDTGHGTGYYLRFATPTTYDILATWKRDASPIF